MKSLPLILVLMLFLGCNKEKNKDCNCYYCPDLPDYSNEPFTTVFSSFGVQYQTPYFNPSNANEFVYVKRDLPNNANYLCVANIQDQTTQVLYDGGYIFSQPKWGGDEIVFVEFPDYFVRSVNVSTGIINILSSNSANLCPAIDNSGDFAYWIYSPVLGVPYHLMKMDMISGTIDTLIPNYYTNNLDVNYDEVLAAVDQNNIISYGSIDVNTGNVNYIKPFEGDYSHSMVWAPDGESFYYIDDLNFGVMHYNIQTGESTEIICICESKKNVSVSVSGDGQKLLCEMENRSMNVVDGNWDGILYQNSSIALIDISTKKVTPLTFL